MRVVTTISDDINYSAIVYTYNSTCMVVEYIQLDEEQGETKHFFRNGVSSQKTQCHTPHGCAHFYL